MNKQIITYLYENKYIDLIDRSLAEMIQRLTRHQDPWVDLGAALVSHYTRQGHVCLDLQDPLLCQWLAEFMKSEIGGQLGQKINPGQWANRLAACAAVGDPGEFTPMILDGHRLYLQRYWSYEQTVAGFVLNQEQQDIAFVPEPEWQALNAAWLPQGDEDQKAAAQLAVERKFCVISGGPGTGKTYTLAKIILLLERLSRKNRIRIKLAAPTGKAAARLQEAIEANLKQMSGSDPILITEKAQTLHRLLAINPQTGRSRFNAAKPLPVDVVIVDEASMVDLSMMAKLVLALPDHARLILSGDKDQLASVEAGAMLGDICYGITQGHGQGGIGGASEKTAGRPTGLRDHIVLLRRNFRFDSQSGIYPLSLAINQGDSETMAKLLGDPQSKGIAFCAVDDRAGLANALEQEIRRYVAPWFAVSDPQSMLEQLDGFKILTVVRQGPYGVEHMNLLVEQVLARMGLIPPRRSPAGHWYAGRPLMVTRNDYYHSLFNGDMGVVVNADRAGDRIRQAVFPDAQGGLRYLSPHQLPPHETAFATTVHKSQGSEFERVVLVLPDQDTALLTRELIYTAVTRARGSVTIMGKVELVAAAVQRPTRRTAGLRDKLWNSVIGTR